MSRLGVLLSSLRDDQAFRADLLEERKWHPGKCDHAILLVHGMNSRAEWYSFVERELTINDAFYVVRPKYGRFGPLRFLSPTDYFQRSPQHQILNTYRALDERGDFRKISIIAHSFGTYLVARLLQQHNLKLYRLIFCGSVVKENFPWKDCQHKIGDLVIGHKTIRNDFSKQDWLPRLANGLSIKYGAAGTYGFHDDVYVENVENPVAHSGYFDREFVKRHWIPFLQS